MLQTISHQAMVLTEAPPAFELLASLLGELGDVDLVDAAPTPHPAGARGRSLVLAAACGTNLVVEVVPRAYLDVTGALARATEHSIDLDEADDPIGRHHAYVKVRASAVVVDDADAASVADAAAALVVRAGALLGPAGAIAWFVPAGEVVMDHAVLVAHAAEDANSAACWIGVRTWRDVPTGHLIADTVGAAAFGTTDVEASFTAPTTTVADARGYVMDALLLRLASKRFVQPVASVEHVVRSSSAPDRTVAQHNVG